MDCNMPVMDGFQATKEIKKMLGEQVYIVALTAYSTDSFRVKCIEAGMDCFITKPTTAENVKAILRQRKLI